MAAGDLESADTVAPGERGSLRFHAEAPRLAGRYQLLGLLGTGGMGAVYRVRDTELGEVVALKMLRPDWARTPEALERFRSEVRLARRVTHRHVARTFDIGEHEGERFITMECVDGGSLASRIAERGALPAGETIEIVRAICAGLAAAHQAGVIHRDLKPENVLFARDGRAVVTDFGIALAGGGDDAAISGTLAYMAPEQLVPGAAIDHRADLYALGVVIHEMLTGVCPWRGDAQALLAQRAAHTAPVDPRALRPELPDALAAIVRRCTAVAAADRFDSAEDVARALPDAITAAAPGPAPAAMPTPSRVGKTVAVLPFATEGPDADRYLADGLTSDLIDTLSMTRGLLVRPRGVVAKYAGSALSPPELGKALSVHVVVEGSVRRIGDAIRVGVRLIGTEDGFQLWARRFDAPLGELMVATDAAAHAIAAALTTELPELAAHHAADPAAIELYLRAKQEFWLSWRNSGKGAAEQFERALALAPDDPRILTGLAQALARMLFFGEGDRDAIAARGREVAERAVALAPELGDTWAALASHRFNSGDEVGSAAALRAGLAHAPNAAALQDQLGRLLAEVSALDEARARLEIALGLDPTLMSARVDLSRVHALRADWASADRMVKPLEQSSAVFSHLGRFALWRGTRIDFGTIKLEGYAVLYAAVLAAPVLTPEHRAWLRDMTAHSTGRIRTLRYQRNAELHAYVGEVDEAFEAIRGAIDVGLLDLAWMDHCPLFATLRDDPRFPPLRDVVAGRAARILQALRG